jgi:GNAT superfamily N-acetyltransferase
VRVRPMHEQDAPAVADLAGQLGYASTPAQIGRRIGILSGEPNSAAFVAEDASGKVIGWVHVVGRAFLEMDPYTEIAGLVVDAGARRLGAGKALVTAAETWALARGYTTMRVRSNVKRVESRPFYEGLGYAIGKSQYVYEKRLT